MLIMRVRDDRASVRTLRGAAVREFVQEAVTFSSPMLLCVELQMGGRLLLTEVVLLAVLPMLLIQEGPRLMARGPRLILGLGLLWLFGQVATDLIRGTPFVDLARGWSKIAFTLINFAALYLLVGDRRRRLLSFALGMCLGWFLMFAVNPIEAASVEPWKFLIFAINPNEFASVEPWKFGVGAPVTILGLFLASVRPFSRMRLTQAAIVGGLGFLNFLMGARLMGGVCFLTAVYLTVQSVFAGRNVHFGRIGAFQFLVFGVIAIVPLILTYSAYSSMASSGWLGEDARRKFELQSSGKFGVLLGGRAESLASINAVMDSPIIGHGSWAKDSRYIDYLYKLYEFGYDPGTIIKEYERADIIPSHSYLMGAWVDAGMLGALFWAVVFWKIPALLIKWVSVVDPWSPLLIYFLVQFAWAILFSPYGHEARITAPYSIVMILFMTGRIRDDAEHGRRAVGPRPA